MASANGRLKSSELVTVQTGVQLAVATAARWNLLKAAAKKELRRSISIAAPYGGYRPYAVQDGMHHAGSPAGTAAERRKYGLNPNSVVAIAAAGYSTHGFGTRLDIVGTPMDAHFLALAKRFGFVLEFGPRDPNHFVDKGTYKVSAVKKTVTKVTAPVKPKAAYYVVKSGDTMTKIAALHSTGKVTHTVADLMNLNPKIKDADAISVGQKIRVA